METTLKCIFNMKSFVDRLRIILTVRPRSCRIFVRLDYEIIKYKVRDFENQSIYNFERSRKVE